MIVYFHIGICVCVFEFAVVVFVGAVTCVMYLMHISSYSVMQTYRNFAHVFKRLCMKECISAKEYVQKNSGKRISTNLHAKLQSKM